MLTGEGNGYASPAEIACREITALLVSSNTDHSQIKTGISRAATAIYLAGSAVYLPEGILGMAPGPRCSILAVKILSGKPVFIFTSLI